MKALTKFKPSLIEQARSWDEYVSLGQQVREMKDVSQWFLGDLAREVQKNYGEDSLGKYAYATGVNPKSLAEYRRVAARFPKKKDRLPFLSFSHHQRALKAKNPRRLLNLAHDNEWSVRQLDRHIIGNRTNNCEKHEWEECRVCVHCGKREHIDNKG